MNWRRTWYLIKSDIWRRAINNGYPRKTRSFAQAALSPSALAGILFRLQHYFASNNLSIFAKIIAVANIILFSVEIGSKCAIDEGFCIGHANGIVIHDRTRIGKNCTIMHQVGLGLKKLDAPGENDFTVLEDDVLVGAGAIVLGPLTIGQGSIIGMNSLVMHSAPANSLIAGCLAKIIRTITEEERAPAEKMQRTWEKRPSCSLKETLLFIREDLINRARTDGKPFTRSAYLRLFLNPPALAVVLFRFCHWLDGHGLTFLVKLFNGINVIFFKTEIGAKACIDGGFVVLHCNGVIINNQTKIGKNVVFAHHNTVSIGPRKDMDPGNDFVTIGDETFIGAGARIIGNLTIGSNCIVAMNEVVRHSAPDNTILVKGKNIPRPLEQDNKTEVKDDAPERINPISWRETKGLIKADIQRRALCEGKKPGFYYYSKIILNPPVLAVLLYRLSHYFRRREWNFTAKILYIMNNLLFSVEIQSLAQIGPGLILNHANGILVHDRSIIGKNCTLVFQNTLTVGPHAEETRSHDYIVVDDEVIIGAGAKIIGPVHIGNRVIISAKSVVTKDAPEDALLFGIPARVVNRRRF